MYYPSSLCLNKGENMDKCKSKDKRKRDLNNQIIQRKNDEIESLKDKISALEIDNAEKDEMINSIESLREEFEEIIADVDVQRNEYRKLVSELFEMRKVMNQEVFKGRWRLIRFLMK